MRVTVRVGAALALSLLLGACAGTAPTSQPTPATPATAAADGAPSGAPTTAPAPATAITATFTYLNNLDVVTEWDPATSYSNEVIAMNNIYEQLTRTNAETGSTEPLLATSWETSADGLTWTFKLRDGVTFSNGNPADAKAA
ncbi:MAG: ABC transporter substrate-binding protein, partial [Actinobacteria bacterium]|nr:ABC transporter substrate-binding protein [Actinomycetota bacterium]